MKMANSEEHQGQVPSRYFNYPVSILRVTSRGTMSSFFNRPLQSLRDWRGLAELLEYDFRSIENFELKEDPTGAMLKNYHIDTRHTVGHLLEKIVELERFDAFDELQSSIDKDINLFDKKKREHEEEEERRQHPTTDDLERDAIRLLDRHLQCPEVSSVSDDSPPMQEVPETDFTTVGNRRAYDAFVSYAPGAPEDLKFVKLLIKKLETDNGLSLMVWERDSLPGGSKYYITADIIEKRCKRMIIILSNSFLRSKECDFQVKFAHCLAPGSHNKKLVPILIDENFSKENVPSVLKHIAMCDYTKKDLQEWFWGRLVAAIKNPLYISPSDYISTDMKSIALSAEQSSSNCPFFSEISTDQSSTMSSVVLDSDSNNDSDKMDIDEPPVASSIPSKKKWPSRLFTKNKKDKTKKKEPIDDSDTSHV